MADLRWFRVTTDAQGGIISVEQVAASGSDAFCIFFVEAVDDAHARKLTESSFAARRMRERRAAWAAAGKCTKCGGERDGARRYCKTCRALKSAENKRATRRGRGEIVVVPTPQEGAATRREFLVEEVRLETLREVARWFHALPERRRFAAKLEELIACAIGKGRAA